MIKKTIYTTTLICSIFSSSAFSGATAPTTKTVTPTTVSTPSAKEKMSDGLIVTIKKGNADIDNWFTNGIETTSFAGFIAKNEPISSKDIIKKSLGYKGAYAIESKGYFNAKEKGTYSFAVLIDGLGHSVDCTGSISLNQTVIASNPVTQVSKEKNVLIFGSLELEEGVYEYSNFSACGDSRGSMYQVKRTFYVKDPKNLNLRAFEEGEILHKK